ncbi:MAG: hypothetical protein WD003_00240 [Candidatus Paceibacterota bacterium]
MYIHPSQKKILWSFVASLLVFTTIFIAQQNFEFIGYVAIVLLLLFAVLFSNKFVRYPNFVLWGLFVWSFFHMLGGVEMADGNVIYTLILIPFVAEPYLILKYDQIIHAFGFFVATLVMYSVLYPHLKKPSSFLGVGIVVAMAGLGLGALNEIIEFFMTVLLPSTNVGGYENTALDLVFNFVGTILAAFFLAHKKTHSVLDLKN